MIHEVSGDILLSHAQAVAHGIGPNDHFDPGLALALRKKWPTMAKDFRRFAHQSHPKPGEIWMWGGTGGARIFNLMTQEGDHNHKFSAWKSIPRKCESLLASASASNRNGEDH